MHYWRKRKRLPQQQQQFLLRIIIALLLLMQLNSLYVCNKPNAHCKRSKVTSASLITMVIGNQQCLGLWVGRKSAKWAARSVAKSGCLQHYYKVTGIYLYKSINIYNSTDFDGWSHLLNFVWLLTHRTGFYSTWLLLREVCEFDPAQHAQPAARSTTCSYSCFNPSLIAAV